MSGPVLGRGQSEKHPDGRTEADLLHGQTGDATDEVFPALHSRGDAAEISFQPLVHELHVRGGLLGGTVADAARCVGTT